MKTIKTFTKRRPLLSYFALVFAITWGGFLLAVGPAALRLADAHTESTAATYMYEFAWRSPQFDGRLGACHGLDVAFAFDTLGYGTEELLGTDPPQQLADTMHAAWVSFATRGDSGWPKYDLDRRATMRFDTTSKVVDDDPRSSERELWEGVR